MPKQFTVTGYDPNGIARVYVSDNHQQTATDSCKEVALEYIQGRPDTGPLTSWRFHLSRAIPFEIKRR